MEDIGHRIGPLDRRLRAWLRAERRAFVVFSGLMVRQRVSEAGESRPTPSADNAGRPVRES
jgi:hypothetical protein